MPLQATSGAASYDAFGGGAAAGPPVYIEDVFSTYLYTGAGSYPTTQTIVNNIDLATKGGLTWIKCRNVGYTHFLNDTVRGAGNVIQSNTTSSNQATTSTFGLTSFNANGFTVKDDGSGPGGALAGQGGGLNGPGNTYASWTWRKQPKFFDIQTYTGNGTAGRQIAHSLGSTPGCIIVKRTSGSETGGIAGWWSVYHRGLSTPQSGAVFLNTTDGRNGGGLWDNTLPTSTNFTLGSSYVNYSGDTYVAYLFAHDAGGFGLTGTDNVISCGSVVSTGNPTEVTLGWEPQWLLIKNATSAQDWWVIDNMRGLVVENAASSKRLHPNDATAETGLNVRPTATGFINGSMTSGDTYIYIAIRRGPMKVPTTGTSVFDSEAYTEILSTQTLTSGWPVDLGFLASRNSATGFYWSDRLRGSIQSANRYLTSFDTSAEQNFGLTPQLYDNSTGLTITSSGAFNNSSGRTDILYMLRRAPSFFDEVCYTGTGSSQNVSHNLAAVPELLIIKRRDSTGNWEAAVPSTTAGSFFVGTSGSPISLNTTNGNGGQAAYAWASNTGTATYFNPSGIFWNGNASGGTYVAYLFATCVGVSKVGTYTGNGTTQTINCGFGAGGARFVLIKRTDSTGDWYVYDTARGMTVLTDPYLLLNTTAAEVATLGSVTTVSTGFALNSAITAAINVNAGTYIFLAIA